MICGQLISCTLIAYGFARFRFRGREFLFLLMLATMLIPEQVTMIPTFLMFSKLEWIDTYLPLIVPTFFGNAFYIFLMRQYMLSIPVELDEAAKIDGANAFQILWKVLVPLLRPPMTIIFVLTFTSVYNDFMGPLIYLNSPEKFTLAVGLANFVSSKGSDWHLLMAASTVVLLPLLAIYYFAQKHLIGGIANMGLKG
ncbi:MAG: carbohydrate ABC transporter permease [Ktedonobacteraceae bacterium]|nr:carbohydrate ABC transporter permease [Ktedonobacteraceae bacterium]